ncbi:pore-forming ESAT-6 family protein [Streptomyces sp. JH002]|jgi:hypothetical protein|uniref:ESAT-6-like protein n=1 Tax=Streptomyces xiamenensis TaxID=408015 RepID=A0A0F7FUH5_9ACTN|nr:MULTISPECIES: pore-forming ESAT-6 family protein [Streptomyces]AKG44127.1 hypothetical protein SXIM_27430 [Streptomyces xiamenensis]MCU4747789.1 pore-forming ESAT-6 family protein [Streptomyces sp. G-5]QQN78411.1 pore-forming ESAT-6 family protein [Streptomyces sp. XC 2026]
MSNDRIGYDVNASGEAQTNIHGVIQQLEQVISARDGHVKNAMADFQADGVSEQYHGAEQRWNTAAEEVRTIIGLLKSTLENNDGTAQNTLRRAQGAVDGIG